MVFTIAVSGAAGRMGRTYAPELIKLGHKVRVYDTNKSELRRLYDDSGAEIYTNNRALVEGANVVLLFTPVPQTEDVLKEMCPFRPSGGGGIPRYLRPDVVIGSAASSKEDVAELEKKYVKTDAYPSSRIVEFHPMHGEGIPVSGQNMLTVPVRDFPLNGSTAETLMQELFVPMGVKIKHVDSPSTHDEILSDPQGGNHSIAFSRDTAWYMSKSDPDKSSVFADPLSDAKSVHARRPLDLNLQVYVVTMMLNKFVPPYLQQYEDVFAEICKKAIEGRREELYRVFEEAREHLGADAIKDAHEMLAAAYGPNLDATNNSHFSDLAWGELYKRRGKKPSDFLDYESFHYALGRTILCGVFGSDIRRLVDNAVDNPDAQWMNYNYGRALAVVNQIVQSGDAGSLLRHFEKLKKYFNGREGVEMKRDLPTVGKHSVVLSRSLKEKNNEYAMLRREAESAP